MAIESRNILKTYFETGDIPTQGQFENLIDSYIHRTDDGVYIFEDPATGEKRFGVGVIQPAYPLGVKAYGSGQALISLHGADPASPHEWSINLDPDFSGNKGFNIGQETAAGSMSRFFINAATGNIGIGTTSPAEKLHVEKSTAAGVTGIKILNTASVGNQGWTIGHLQSGVSERDGALIFIDTLTGNERTIITPTGHVGINEAEPDTFFHVSRPVSDPMAVISLVEGTGIAVIGPITDNIVMDFQGIQARHGEYIGNILNLTVKTLHLQNLGGEILIHGDSAITNDQKIIITADTKLGIGTVTPIEKVDVNGAIKIGNTQNNNGNDGAIRWTGTDFEGKKPQGWVSLTAGNGPWSIGTDNTIYYDTGLIPRVAIGTNIANATLSVESDEETLQANTAALIRNISTITGGGQGDNRVALEVTSSGFWGGDALSSIIGLYVSEVSGQPDAEVNLAAVLNGNVVIGNVAGGSSIIGSGGNRVFALQIGNVPSTSIESSTQLYSSLVNGHTCLHLRNDDDVILKLYRESALTPDNPNATPQQYTGTTVEIINNMRLRINELEAKLQAIGFIA